MSRVMVMMSGGVDSSVAAAMLLDRGHEVTGVTLKLWGGDSDSGCCSVADVEDARRVGVVAVDLHGVAPRGALRAPEHEVVVDRARNRRGIGRRVVGAIMAVAAGSLNVADRNR